MSHHANLKIETRKERQETSGPGHKLVAEGLEGLRRLLVDSGVLLRLGDLALRELLALVVGGTLGLSPLLEPRNRESVLLFAILRLGQGSRGGDRQGRAPMPSPRREPEVEDCLAMFR